MGKKYLDLNGLNTLWTKIKAKITAAIQALDVSSVGGDGKYISAISETDGKISANATTMDTTPTANSKKAVTSGGIKTALDGKSATSHTHKVKINGTEKTIAATSGAAVDLGTYLTSHQNISGKADLENTSQTILAEPSQSDGNKYLIVSQTTFGGSSTSAWRNYDLSMIIESRHSGTGLAVIQCNVNTNTPTETDLTGSINIFTSNALVRISSPLMMYRKYDASTYKWTITVVVSCRNYNNFKIKSILSKNGLNYSTSCSYVTDLTTLGTKIATAVTASNSNHSHGNIANGGTLTDTAAAAAGNDYVVIRDAYNAKIQTSTIKGMDVADAVSKKHSHSTLTQSEVDTGTNTTGKLVTAKVIHDSINNSVGKIKKLVNPDFDSILTPGIYDIQVTQSCNGCPLAYSSSPMYFTMIVGRMDEDVFVTQCIPELSITRKNNGDGTFAECEWSHTEGGGTTGEAKFAHAEGSGYAVGMYSHAEGEGTTVSEVAAHAEGSNTQATAYYAHAEGHKSKAQALSAHAEGLITTASGVGAHAEGNFSTASGKQAHAEGYSSTADGETSHAEGSLTKASGVSAHAEGGATQALGKDAHSEGLNTRVNSGSTACHSEGYSTGLGNSYADGTGSHNEGYDTKANGSGAHAEGYQTKSFSTGSHSEGYQTEAKTNPGTHAEGLYSVASGNGAHAEGIGTKAFSDAMHAAGMYNLADAGFARVTGWGTDTARKDIEKLDTVGNLTLEGDIVAKNNKLICVNGFTYEQITAALANGRTPYVTDNSGHIYNYHIRENTYVVFTCLDYDGSDIKVNAITLFINDNVWSGPALVGRLSFDGHTHSADAINYGILPVARGGTGQSSLSNVTVGAATKATNDSTGDNIANQFTSVRQSISSLESITNDIMTDNYFFRGLRYMAPVKVLTAYTPTTTPKKIEEWYGYTSTNKRLFAILTYDVWNSASGSSFWYVLRVTETPISGGSARTYDWLKFVQASSFTQATIIAPLFGYNVKVEILKNSSKNTGSVDVWQSGIVVTGVKEHYQY